MAGKALYVITEEIEEIKLKDTPYTSYRAPPNTPATASTFRVAWGEETDLSEENDHHNNLPTDSASDISVFSHEDRPLPWNDHRADLLGITLPSDSETSLDSLNDHSTNLPHSSDSDSDISLFSWSDKSRVNVPSFVPKLDLSCITSPEKYPPPLYIIQGTSEGKLNFDTQHSKKVIVPSFVPKMDLHCITPPDRYHPTLYIIKETGEEELNIGNQHSEKVMLKSCTKRSWTDAARSKPNSTISENCTTNLKKKTKKFKTFRNFVANIYEFLTKCVQG